MKVDITITMDHFDKATRHYLLGALREMISEERWATFTEVLDNRTRHITIVLEDIFQPHNASAVIRTCELLGVQDLHIIENQNPYQINPDIVVGSHKWINIIRYNQEKHNTLPCYQQLRQSGYRIIATSPHKKGYTPDTLPVDKKTALIIGNEGNGLSETALQQADDFLSIPSYGFTESYNLSVSAALCLFELRKRIIACSNHWQLNTEEKEKLLLDYAFKTVRDPETLLKVLLERQSTAEKKMPIFRLNNRKTDNDAPSVKRNNNCS